MSDAEEGYGSDVDEETSYEDHIYDGKKNVAVILIDVCPSMFDSTRLFKMCLLTVYQIMNRMLIKAYRRNISVCLLRDDDIILTALNDNLIDSTKKILKLLKQPIDSLRQKFERKSGASLRYTLTECLKQLHNLEKVNPYIVVLTNDEDPTQNDQNEKLSAIDVALSFKEMDVKMIVLPLKENFNFAPFYKELLKAANDVPLDVFEDDYEKSYTSVEDLNDILDCIIKDKVNVRRYMFRLYEKTGKEVYFWAQMRYLVNNHHLYQNSIISRTNNNKLKQALKDPSNIDMDKLTINQDGCKPIKFSKKDYLFVRMPYGFRLLYVSEEKQGSIHYMNKRGFIMQNDELTESNKSQNIFDYMWEYCKNKNRYLICGLYTPGNKQHPKIVELTPDSFQSKPCFIGQYLANCDHVVEVPDSANMEDIYDEDKKFTENEPQLGLVCDMIDKLKLEKFIPSQWTDIKYETKAAHIKAQFLDIDVESVESSFPTEEEITERLGATNDELKEIFEYTVAPPAAKRSRKK